VSVATLKLIETRLEKHKSIRKRLRSLRQRSAVAMILQVRAGELHILMIKRAEREGDPWSGHMAFPGGRMDSIDAHGFDVAVRETSEEIGVELGADDICIGRLSEVSAKPGRGGLGMVVTPFVFRLDREVEFQPNYEVAEVVWVPMEFLLDSANQTTMDWEYKGAKFNLPCYWYEERCIWGLSLMMLGELLDVADGTPRRRTRWRR
jgi:8-oxo-dGTP pyrophosphatase MutT (NUDIX family)